MTDPSPTAGQSGAAPDEPPTVRTSPVPVARPVATQQQVVDRPVPVQPTAPKRRRLWWRILRVVLLVILLPCIALGIGLLIAWIAHLIRGNGDHIGTVPAPSASASATPTAAASASAPPRVVVPADWIVEVSPPAGLTYRHPPGWVRRTQTPEVFRFAPASPGSTSPGVEGVGAGFEESTDPATALQSFAARAYGGEPGFVAQAVTAVTGGHPEEKQEIVTYRRSGVLVRVVMRSFRLQGHTVLALGRSRSEQPARAAQLESYVEASLRFSS
jgi:hypothetical protein